MKPFFLLLCVLPILISAKDFQFPQNVSLGGELEQRVRLTEKRFLHEPYDLNLIVQDVARKPDLTRRFEEYEGDVSGRTLGCWSYMSRLLGEHPTKLDSIFETVLQYQADAGYFGIDQEEIDWDYWGRQTFGHGRLLGGLVQYYHLTKDERAKNSATKLGDYFVKSISKWTSSHNDNPWTNKDEWVMWSDQKSNRQHFVKTHMTSILESMMMLYEINPKQDYLDAGKSILELFPDFGHYHSHSYMNTMTGMAMLYDHTGDHKVFSRLYNLYWQDVVRYGYTVDGGMREWFPDDHRTEGCSITDWIRLNLYMWKITQDAVYLDEAENAWYNGLNYHQTANGAFGHANCTPSGYEANYDQAWWCCTMHGLWSYAEIVNFLAAADDDNLWFNFYAPSDFELNGATFSMTTDYPQDGSITIECLNGGTAKMVTHLRIPTWVDKFTLKLNGKNAQSDFSGGVAAVQHSWKRGDKLTLDIPLALRIVDNRGNDLLKRRSVGHDVFRASFFYGPLLLGADTKHGSLPDEIFFDAEKNYQIKGEAKPFALPKVHFMMPSVSSNFQSATTLVPVSEQTSYKKWTDEWINFQRNAGSTIQRQAVQYIHNIRIKR